MTDKKISRARVLEEIEKWAKETFYDLDVSGYKELRNRIKKIEGDLRSPKFRKPVVSKIR